MNATNMSLLILGIALLYCVLSAQLLIYLDRKYALTFFKMVFIGMGLVFLIVVVAVKLMEVII